MANRASRLLGDDLVGFEALTGGQLSSVLRISLVSGGSAVVKSGGAPQIEADMLQAIRASGAPTPKVLAVEADVLILEDLGTDAGLSGAWASLGSAVRTLHASVGSRYGWPVDYSFGSVAIPNKTQTNWPRFWAEQRLLEGARGVPAALVRRIETLCQSLPDRLPADPEPALLHGDLWAGNVVSRAGHVRGFVDPACYYGHREVDLAMLCLFGSPDAVFWNAYGMTPEPDFESRRAIYQLWPALVHLRLFGDPYHALVEQLLRRCSV